MKLILLILLSLEMR